MSCYLRGLLRNANGHWMIHALEVGWLMGEVVTGQARSCLIKTQCYDVGNQHLITGSSDIRHMAIIQLLR
uniref:Uncharacterized protein n=1 Tax=Oryza punctata TaxID=4537 RepID=A0A0E0KYU3_ORYPU